MTTHQDFGGRAVPTVDTIAGGGSVRECDASDTSCAADSDGHGTHVAGTAGGRNFGVAKEAVLHAMKVCCGGGSNINGGMDWIAQYAQKPAVMTMSLGSYSTPESSRVAVNAVVNSGVTVVVSAGNRGTDSCLKSYTFIASAIGVGSSTSTNARSGFSNFGTCNAIFAPGSTIVSASHTSDSGSATKSGTSMAAPHVAGAVALLLEENPTLVAGEGVRSALRSRATANVLSGLKQGDPNLLLNVGGGGGGPSPTPPSPTPPSPPSPTPPTPPRRRSSWPTPTPSRRRSPWPTPPPSRRRSSWPTPTPSRRRGSWPTPTPSRRRSSWPTPTPSRRRGSWPTPPPSRRRSSWPTPTPSR